MTAPIIATTPRPEPRPDHWGPPPAVAGAYHDALTALPEGLRPALFRLMDGGEVAGPSAPEAAGHLLPRPATAGGGPPDGLAGGWEAGGRPQGRGPAGARAAADAVAPSL